MLMQIVTLSGAALVGSKDIMAVSRAWSHSFAGLRRLHSLSSVTVTFPGGAGAWVHRSLERSVQQSPTSSRRLRFSAQAAELEDSPDIHYKRGGRLSRAERYALVESFVVRHKDAHEGKWPSVNAIVKEIGGSRLIVKDIVEELEKNAKVNSEVGAAALGEDGPSNRVERLASAQVRSDGGELAAGDMTDEQPQSATAIEVDARRHLADDVEEATQNSSEADVKEQQKVPPLKGDQPSSSSLGQSKVETREKESESGLWRRLRDLGQQESQNGAERGPLQQQQQQLRAPPVLLDSYDSDAEQEEEEEDEEEEEEEWEEEADIGDEGSTHDAHQMEAAGDRRSTKSSSGAGPSSGATNPGDAFGLFIRFLPRSATEADLRAAFQDCGEILRAQAMVPKGSGYKFTYGFVDFSTQGALSKALKKGRVPVNGSPILTEACSGQRRTGDFRSSKKTPSDQYRKSEQLYGNSDSRSGPDGSIRGTVNRSGSRIKRQAASHPGSSENGSRPTSVTGDGSYLAVVEGLPYPMPISAVEKMLSAHGDVSRSELARGEGGTYSAHVEFKTEEARDSALASSRIYLGGRWCRITSGKPIVTTVVRLSNVGSVSESFILQRCGKFGRVDNIVHRKEDVVDVYYHPSERRNMRKILDRLSDTKAEFKRWHVNLAPRCSLEEIRSSAQIQDWVEVQKDKLLENLSGAMKSMIIDLEDLRELVDVGRSDLSSSGQSSRNDRSSSSNSTDYRGRVKF